MVANYQNYTFSQIQKLSMREFRALSSNDKMSILYSLYRLREHNPNESEPWKRVRAALKTLEFSPLLESPMRVKARENVLSFLFRAANHYVVNSDLDKAGKLYRAIKEYFSPVDDQNNISDRAFVALQTIKGFQNQELSKAAGSGNVDKQRFEELRDLSAAICDVAEKFGNKSLKDRASIDQNVLHCTATGVWQDSSLKLSIVR